jgi:hypothetical protein
MAGTIYIISDLILFYIPSKFLRTLSIFSEGRGAQISIIF